LYFPKRRLKTSTMMSKCMYIYFYTY
jgi:hypothetical protein